VRWGGYGYMHVRPRTGAFILGLLLGLVVGLFLGLIIGE